MRALQAQPPPSPSSAQQRVAYKLLVYLRTTFRGLAFPPGSGPLDVAGLGSGGSGGEVKAELRGLLLFADVKVRTVYRMQLLCCVFSWRDSTH